MLNKAEELNDKDTLWYYKISRMQDGAIVGHESVYNKSKSRWYKSLKAGEEITYVTAYATGIMLGDIASYAEIGEWKLPQEIAVSSAYTKTYNSGSFNLGVAIS